MRLTDLQKYVRLVLENNEKSRESDRVLCLDVYRQLGVDTRASFESVLMCETLPSLESIGRCRRKLQATYPHLRASDNVIEYRAERADTFKDYSHDHSDIFSGWEGL